MLMAIWHEEGITTNPAVKEPRKKLDGGAGGSKDEERHSRPDREGETQVSDIV